MGRTKEASEKNSDKMRMIACRSRLLSHAGLGIVAGYACLSLCGEALKHRGWFGAFAASGGWFPLVCLAMTFSATVGGVTLLCLQGQTSLRHAQFLSAGMYALWFVVVENAFRSMDQPTNRLLSLLGLVSVLLLLEAVPRVLPEAGRRIPSPPVEQDSIDATGNPYVSSGRDKTGDENV